MMELSGVGLMWHVDYDDGPITGICKYKNKMHFFYMDDGDIADMQLFVGGTRIYKVIPLTILQTTYELLRRLAFNVMVIKCPFITPAIWYSKMFKSKSDEYLAQRIEPIGFFRR